MAKYSSQGSAFSWGGVVITNVFSITGTVVNNTEIDVTDLASTFREYLGAIPDGGEITLELFLDPNDTDIATLMTDATARTVKAVIINLSDSGGAGVSHFDGNGFIKTIPIAIRVDQAIQMTVTIKFTGAVTFTAVA